jgi:hypothetical protein
MAGVTVELLGEDSSVIATTITSNAGRYSFDGLPAGTYKIKFSKLPDGLVFTSRAAGDNTAVDCDAYPSGVTALFTLGNDNPADMSIDAGLTTRDNYHPVPGRNKVPVEAALSTTGGVAPHIPLVGAALVIAGASCLLGARWRRSH